jgi:excisionase family DNA binding protein
VTDSNQIPSLDELARDPVRATNLEPSERVRVQLQCAAILAALAQIPIVEGADDLLEPSKAAGCLHVSRSTVYEMLKDGRLPYVEKGKRGKLIPQRAIHDFVERQTKRAAQPTLDAVRARVRLKTHGKRA